MHCRGINQLTKPGVQYAHPPPSPCSSVAQPGFASIHQGSSSSSHATEGHPVCGLVHAAESDVVHVLLHWHFSAFAHAFANDCLLSQPGTSVGVLEYFSAVCKFCPSHVYVRVLVHTLTRSFGDVVVTIVRPGIKRMKPPQTQRN